MFRQTYNATVDTFPGAILVMSGVISVILGLLHFYLYRHRSVMVGDEGESDSESTGKTANGERAAK